MKKYLLTTLAIFLAASAFCQKSKPKPAAVFRETLYPVHGKESDSFPSYARVIEEKYGVQFLFSKINELHGGACVFSTLSDDGPRPAELHVMDSYPYPMQSADSNYTIQAKYIKYLPNKKTPIAGAVIVVFTVYRNSGKKY